MFKSIHVVGSRWRRAADMNAWVSERKAISCIDVECFPTNSVFFFPAEAEQMLTSHELRAGKHTNLTLIKQWNFISLPRGAGMRWAAESARTQNPRKRTFRAGTRGGQRSKTQTKRSPKEKPRWDVCVVGGITLSRLRCYSALFDKDANNNANIL